MSSSVSHCIGLLKTRVGYWADGSVFAGLLRDLVGDANAEEARRQKRRIKSTKRTATPDGAKSMASSRPVTGEQVGIITTGHEAEVTGKQNVTGASPVYDSRLS